MAKSKYGYTHLKRRHKKRPGRHAKKRSKRVPMNKRTRGQG